MNTKMTDSEIVTKVIEALDLTVHAFTLKLKYSASSVYQVIKGRNTLSSSMIERIIHYFPNVNYKFLKDGEGEVLLDDVQRKNQMNLFNIADDNRESIDSVGLSEKFNTLIMLQQRANELQVQTNEYLKELIQTKKAE